MKQLLIVLGVAAAALPSFLVDPQKLLDTVFPLSGESVSCGAIDLGRLDPGTVYHGKFNVRNHAVRTIYLRPIQTDCGCVIVDAEPGKLPARSTQSIQVTGHAPDKPGAFTRLIVLGPRNDPRVNWVAKIKGVVEAEVWTEPGHIHVQVAPGANVESVVAVRHRPNVELARITSSSPVVQIIEQWPIEDGQMVKLLVQNSWGAAKSEERPVLRIYTKTSATPHLEIPVQCAQPQAVAFIPQRIDLDDFAAASPHSDSLKLTVVALSRDSRFTGLQVESLVPWLDVKSERVADSTLKLDLTFDTRGMPTSMNAAVVRVTLADGAGTSTLLAHRSSR